MYYCNWLRLRVAICFLPVHQLCWEHAWTVFAVSYRISNIYITDSYSLSSHECTSVGQTKLSLLPATKLHILRAWMRLSECVSIHTKTDELLFRNRHNLVRICDMMKLRSDYILVTDDLDLSPWEPMSESEISTYNANTIHNCQTGHCLLVFLLNVCV